MRERQRERERERLRERDRERKKESKESEIHYEGGRKDDANKVKKMMQIR